VVAKAVQELTAALGAGAVSIGDADRLAACVDLWPRHLIAMRQGVDAVLPAAVVWPESTTQIQRVVQWARTYGVPLVPYGAGSSVVGGASAQNELHVVVDLKRMARLVEVDTQACTATAQTGIMGELLERELDRRGFTQGHFPSSIYCSTLGGWIAARGAGQMSSRYGKIEDQVVGGTVVLGDGSIVRHRPSPVLDPLWPKLIGSEGTLGIWAEATMRIHRAPAARIFRSLVFPDLARALWAARDWLTAGLTPAVVRIYDPLDTLLQGFGHQNFAPHDRGPDWAAYVGARLPLLTRWVTDAVSHSCRVIVALQGCEESAAAQLALLQEIALRRGARDEGPGPGERWYERRYAISYRQSSAYRAGVAADTMEVACPWDRAMPVYEAVRRSALSTGVQVMAHFSHVYLDGVSIYFTYAFLAARGVSGYDELWRNCLEAATSAGANVSHHHGAGRLKSHLLLARMGGARQVLSATRRVFDPDHILNPEVLAEPPVSGSDAQRPVAAAERADGAAFLRPVPAQARLRDLEAELNREHESLGVTAELFSPWTVLAAARAGLLWRFNPQLRAIEPLVAGVDGATGSGPVAFVPAPRAALGPDLIEALLAGTPDRLWLRTQRPRRAALMISGPLGRVLELVRLVTQDEDLSSVQLSLVAESGRISLLIAPHPEISRQLTERRLRELVGEGLEIKPTRTSSAWPALGTEPFFFAGPHRSLREFIAAAIGERLVCRVPFLDAIGAAGFVHRPDLSAPDPETRSRLEALADELGLFNWISREPAPSAVPGAEAAAPLLNEPVEAKGMLPLVLHGHRGALANCTYCPKLCRFACPVAVAQGSETLTPRQLMLTANLDRTERRPLTPDVAERLWSCMDCRGCRNFCDHDNDVATVLGDARAELVRQEVAPARIMAFLQTIENTGRMPDRPADDDAALAVTGDGEDAETWLFLGCQGSRQDPGPARALLALARARFGKVHVPSGLGCCGQPLWRWGARRGFVLRAQSVGKSLKRARRIVVDDPGCAYTLRHLYPHVGVETPEVLTPTHLLAHMKWRLPTEGSWAPHDNCFCTRYLNEATLRMQLAEQGDVLASGSVLEGEAGSCGGSLLSFYDPELARKVVTAHVQDLISSGAERILAASPTCRRRLLSVFAPVDDLVELWSRSHGRLSEQMGGS